MKTVNSNLDILPICITVAPWAQISSRLPRTTNHARGGCNDDHRHDKILMKNSKCAILNEHIQNGRPSRYQKRERINKVRESRAKKKKHVRKCQKKDTRRERNNTEEQKLYSIWMLCPLSKKMIKHEE